MEFPAEVPEKRTEKDDRSVTHQVRHSKAGSPGGSGKFEEELLDGMYMLRAQKKKHRIEKQFKASNPVFSYIVIVMFSTFFLSAKFQQMIL